MLLCELARVGTASAVHWGAGETPDEFAHALVAPDPVHWPIVLYIWVFFTVMGSIRGRSNVGVSNLSGSQDGLRRCPFDTELALAFRDT